MALTISTAARNNSVAAIGALCNSGKLRVLTTLDVVLVEFDMPATAFSATSAGVITANAIAPTNATAAGTAAKYRVFDSSNNQVIEGTVTAVGGGGDAQISPSTAITLGQQITVTSLVYTMPATA